MVGRLLIHGNAFRDGLSDLLLATTQLCTSRQNIERPERLGTKVPVDFFYFDHDASQ